jgi:tetratricopeptide (TPR) repeat protein
MASSSQRSLSRHWILCALALGSPGLALSADANLSVQPAPFKAAYVPQSDAEQLQDVPSSADPKVAEFRSLRAMLDTAPDNPALALQLADAYIDYGRQIGDAHYAGYAEAIITPWLSAAQPAARAMVTEATILQYRHQFPEARVMLHGALKADPRNAQAWLTLATLDMVQGDYDSAARNCAQVSGIAGFELGIACVGNLHSYTGRARQSMTLLQQVEHAGTKNSDATQAWIEGLLAETAERLGDWPLAESHYLSALKLKPRDNFLLVTYADFLLDRERPKEVLVLLADHAQSDTAFLRLCLAQAALHSDEAPRYSWIMAARFEALRLRGSDFFGREQARFALELEHDPRSALDLARRNWQVQREPWDTRLLLAAALAAREPQAAVEALDFLQNTKLEDPMIQPLARELRLQLRRPWGASN